MNDNKTPKVSVSIPAYNCAGLITDTIESVIAQTFTDFELIIVDDCSTDKTRDVIQKYLKLDPRIKYIRNDKNLGIGRDFNHALQCASGEYIKILNHDDILKPACLEKSVKVLDEYRSVVLVSCARLMVTKDLMTIRTLRYSDRFEVVKGTDAINKCLCRGNLIGESSAALFRKTSASRGFDERFRQILDMELWFNLLEKGDYAFIPEELCLYRQHPDQLTARNIRDQLLNDEEFLIRKEYLYKKYVRIPFLAVQRLRFNMAYYSWDKNRAAKIAEYCSPLIFYPLLLIKKLKRFL